MDNASPATKPHKKRTKPKEPTRKQLRALRFAPSDAVSADTREGGAQGPARPARARSRPGQQRRRRTAGARIGSMTDVLIGSLNAAIAVDDTESIRENLDYQRGRVDDFDL